jgi:tetratricopeptide (TPR) repeat protein
MLKSGPLAVCVLLTVNTSALVRAADEDQPAQARPVAPSPAAGSVQTLLEEGFATGTGKSAEAHRNAVAAQRLAPTDPRVNYAYGLVLMKLAQHTNARALFEAAVKQPGPAYWPAWQASIWTALANRQYETGLKQLDEFAVLVARPATDPDARRSQRDAAVWIGQIIEALDKTVEQPKRTRDRIARSEDHIRKSFNDELHDAFHAGREVVRDRYDEATGEMALREEAAAKKEERDLQDESAKVASDLGKVEQQKENTARTAEELKKQMEDQVAALDKQLGELERDYKALEKRAESIQRSYILAGREVTVLQLQTTGNGPSQTAPGGAVTRNQQLLQQRQNEMAAYELEYNATSFRMGQVAQAARGVVVQRAAVIRDYELATGQLVKKNAALDKWSSRLSDKKKKLTSATAKARTATPTDVRIKSIATLVPFDLDEEKNNVLKSFGLITAAEPEDKP